MNSKDKGDLSEAKVFFDKIAIVPIQEIGNQKTISLRIEPPVNNQNNVKYFDDYSFEKFYV